MSEKYSELFVREGSDKVQYGIAAMALHGELREVNQHVIAVGQDTILAIPPLSIFGVFDGAGGADDIGRPELASQTAALAAQEYFLNQEYRNDQDLKERYNHEHEVMAGAMRHLRREVDSNELAGLTTATMFRIFDHESGTTLTYANAGDSALLLYPDPDHEERYKETRLIAGDQISKLYWGSPSNIVGRQPFRLRHLESYGHDQVGFAGFDRFSDRYLLLGTDGVMGNYTNGTEMQGYHVEYALETEPKIQNALSDEFLGAMLKWKAFDEGLDLDNFDREQWENLVEPLLEDVVAEKPSLGSVATSLMDPRIAWDFERNRHPDDKSLVVVKLPKSE